MPRTIPQNASRFTIPNVGEVAVYSIGSWWWAVYSTQDTRGAVGMGTTLVDAVANLLMGAG